MIPLGDINLRRQIQANSVAGVVGRLGERVCARRIYTAKVAGQNSKFTVAIYQGFGAEEVCCILFLCNGVLRTAAGMAAGR
jgi:hypothetical protein